jgi:uncharacterized protein (TIGR03086 family)
MGPFYRTKEEDMHLDLTPATETLAEVVSGIGDDQLSAPTPCRGVTVADLLDHVDGLCLAFTAAAAKDLEAGTQPPSADGSRLGADWRTRIPGRLAALAAAWRDDAAWAGMTRAGSVDLPAEVAATVAIDELVVHCWDLAMAAGLNFAADEAMLNAAYGFAQAAVARDPDGSAGLFGPPVAVPDGAELLDRLLGLTGRDPVWRPDGQH